uniref:Reverse transcriptase domain-containing protein n=1 Tax=Juglanconis juglandina TaxID=1940567 RepID=A0A291LJ08_9PEZI|nr:hypothetical protein [Juglanconis juglandina]
MNKPQDSKEESVSLRDKLVLNESDQRCVNAYKLISQRDTLQAAYWILKSKPGMMVKGSDDETLDGIDMDWFKSTEDLLNKEVYQPKPTRRVYIPKANGKTRPLGIASPRDRIIQQAIKMVLEAKLDPIYSDKSHGFRPNKGCHTALREIRDWKGVAWFIEGDIKAFFDCIDHRILEKLLMRHFQDSRLINLYWKIVKAGYVEWDTNKMKYIASDIGVPQGGIISPLLSNLILNELDVYIEGIRKEYEEKNRGIKDKLSNPVYRKQSNQLVHLRKKLNKCQRNTTRYEEVKGQIKQILKIQNKTGSMVPNPLAYPTIKYVRYADDWLIGVWGKKSTAVKLKEQIKEFLESLKLTLSSPPAGMQGVKEKTLITNARSQEAKFLGTRIKRVASNKHMILTKSITTGRTRRIPSGNIRMSIPLKGIIKRLEDKKFFVMEKGKWKMKSIPKFTILPMKDIIRRYRSIYNGFFNYYRFADNIGGMMKVYWILKESLRKTLSRKFGVGKRELYGKYGKDLGINYSNSKGETQSINFSIPKPKKDPMNFAIQLIPRDPLYAGIWKVRTISSLGTICASCGSEEVEMHHLKHIRTLNVKLGKFDQMVAKINRKQVPLCRECHMKVHKGEYQGLSLKHLKVNKRPDTNK